MLRMTKQNTSNEETVRRFMLFVENPDQLIDPIAVEKASQAFIDAKDPIDKLKALGDLDKARNIDEAPLREAFVSVAKAWADANNIPVSVFREMRVPDDVLVAAGFEVNIKPTVRGRVRKGEGRQRAKAVPVEQIKAHVAGLADKFVLADIVESIGGSSATVAKAVNELVDEGKVDRLGPMPNYNGRGRAPVQYLVKAA